MEIFTVIITRRLRFVKARYHKIDIEIHFAMRMKKSARIHMHTLLQRQPFIYRICSAQLKYQRQTTNLFKWQTEGNKNQSNDKIITDYDKNNIHQNRKYHILMKCSIKAQ